MINVNPLTGFYNRIYIVSVNFVCFRWGLPVCRGREKTSKGDVDENHNVDYVPYHFGFGHCRLLAAQRPALSSSKCTKFINMSTDAS